MTTTLFVYLFFFSHFLFDFSLTLFLGMEIFSSYIFFIGEIYVQKEKRIEKRYPREKLWWNPPQFFSVKPFTHTDTSTDRQIHKHTETKEIEEKERATTIPYLLSMFPRPFLRSVVCVATEKGWSCEQTIGYPPSRPID